MTKMAFEKRYSDDSGVEFAVRYDSYCDEIQFQHIDSVEFKIDQIDWLIECLNKIKLEQEITTISEG